MRIEHLMCSSLAFTHDIFVSEKVEESAVYATQCCEKVYLDYCLHKSYTTVTSGVGFVSVVMNCNEALVPDVEKYTCKF